MNTILRATLTSLIIGNGGSLALGQTENRSFDGIGNATNDLGHADSPFLRLVEANYPDGTGVAFDRADLPNPRLISNVLAAQTSDIGNQRRGTDYVWQWGQFIDHDLTLAEAGTGEDGSIRVLDQTDPLFPIVPLTRSKFEQEGTHPRDQVNGITSFLDASMVYGSDQERADALRTMTSGRLRVTDDNLLPFNDTTLGMDVQGTALQTELRLAGDVRANEQPGLLALHTLFVREHNRLATELAKVHPDWSDEQLYQRARRLVGALMQKVTYQEWLPALLGSGAPRIENFSYQAEVDPRVSNEFATAFFRLGHTMVSPRLMRIRNDNWPDETISMGLREVFFAPGAMTDEGTLDLVLKGLGCQLHQKVDMKVNEDLRNFLFGQPGSGGLDLAALNIQRGREHGLASYNTLREFFQLEKATSWAAVTTDTALQQQLASLYNSVDDLELWVGALCEDPVAGSALGELLTTAIAAEFSRIAQGDRFFYRWDAGLSVADREWVESNRLCDIIERNSGLTSMQEDVFILPDAPEVKIVQKTGEKPKLAVMGDPGKSYNFRQSNDLSVWSKPMLDSALNSGISRHWIVLGESDEQRGFFQLIEE